MFFRKQVTTNIYFNFPVLVVNAILKNRIVGSIKCTVHNDGNTINIGDIQCNRNNKGYGSFMMKALIEYGKRNNYKSIEGWISQVDVDHIDRLHHFYRKFGFNITQNTDSIKIEDISLVL